MLEAGGTGSFGRFFRLDRPNAFWELLLPLPPPTTTLSRSCPLSRSPPPPVVVRVSVLGFFFFLGLLDSELLVPENERANKWKKQRPSVSFLKAFMKNSLAFEDAESDGEISEEPSHWRRDMINWPSGAS